MKTDRRILEKVNQATLSMQRFQWEQGTVAQAFLELGETDMAVLLARSAAYRDAPDGRLGVMDLNRSVDDPAAVGEALLFAAEQTGEDWLQKAADRMHFYLKNRAPKSTDGILYHYNIINEIWVDAYYMAPPFLAAAGDFPEAMKQIKGFRKYLFDEEKGLHSHIWEDDRQEFGRKDFWGVGNGWAMAGVTRVIGMLPEDSAADREYLISFVKKMIDGVLNYQMEDGRFHDILDRPDTFADTNTGQMTAYSIYRGVQRGYLDRSYLKAADKARTAAWNQVDEYGFVQEVCGLPNFDRPYVAPEGQAFFLLMEAAANDLQESGANV